MENFDELYYRKPYIKSFDAAVVSCEPAEGKAGGGSQLWAVELDQTAFYPEGGGQPGDQGILKVIQEEADGGNLPQAMPGAVFACGRQNIAVHVSDTRKKGDRILHYCDNPLPVGLKIRGELDWQLRSDRMQAHSGEHIVSGIIHQKFGFENVGFHMGEEFTTIDFSGPLTWEQVEEIERLANEAVRADIPFTETFPAPEELDSMDFRSKKELSGTVRIVSVPGYDVCACCGTHVMRSGEVGMIKIASLVNRKKGARLEMLAGRRALLYWQRELDQVTGVCQLLSLQPHELLEGVKKLEAERNALRYKLHGMVQKALEKEADSIIAEEPESPLLIRFAEGANMDDLRGFCNRLMDSGKYGTCAALSVETEEKTNYIIMSRTLDLKPLAKPLNQALNGRGGGSRDMIQGSYGASSEEIVRVLEEQLK